MKTLLEEIVLKFLYEVKALKVVTRKSPINGHIISDVFLCGELIHSVHWTEREQRIDQTTAKYLVNEYLGLQGQANKTTGGAK